MSFRLKSQHRLSIIMPFNYFLNINVIFEKCWLDYFLRSFPYFLYTLEYNGYVWK